MDLDSLEVLGTQIDEVFFIIGLALLGIEILKHAFEKTLSWKGGADAVANVSTQIPFILVETLLLAGAYGIYWIIHENYIPWGLEITPLTIGAAVLMADFLYYWEHRIAHRTRIFWVQHAVHHSSRFMNITTGIRFGPFEGVLTLVVSLPMALAGFPPELILFGHLVVLAYQTWIHTELIGKLGPLELVLNTPANHRVHHGCDEKYLDKNYGGILIIWDRMFGTFQPEEETPRYGLARDYSSVNPLSVWFSEWPKLFRDLGRSGSLREFWMRLFGPPNWQPAGTYHAESVTVETGDKGPQ